MIKKQITLLCCLLLILTAAGCNKGSSPQDENQTTSGSQTDGEGNNEEANNDATIPPDTSGTQEEQNETNIPATNNYELLQLTPMQKGEDIAIIKTTKGDIKLRFFPSDAPKAVENFLTHAKNGYYNGVNFHRVIENFMIQSGDPKGDGTGGESIWGEPFELELSPRLHHFRGALCMARTEDPVSNGSQFYIVQNPELNATTLEVIKGYTERTDLIEGTEIRINEVFSQEAFDVYKEQGGVPNLDFYYTVFGQVYEGMEIVDAIAKVEVEVDEKNPNASKPVEDITITAIEVSKFQ